MPENTYPSRMNYDSQGGSFTEPIKGGGRSLYYLDGRPFKGDMATVVSAHDMELHPERYYSHVGFTQMPYLVDLSSIGQPGRYIYNEYGNEIPLTTSAPVQGLRSAHQKVRR